MMSVFDRAPEHDRDVPQVAPATLPLGSCLTGARAWPIEPRTSFLRPANANFRCAPRVLSIQQRTRTETRPVSHVLAARVFAILIEAWEGRGGWMKRH